VIHPPRSSNLRNTIDKNHTCDYESSKNIQKDIAMLYENLGFELLYG